MTVDLQAATDEMNRRARRNIRLALAGDEIEAAMKEWDRRGNDHSIRRDHEGQYYAEAAHDVCELIEKALNG